tara:strand:- start:574 stop:744 length:171 start_codon:yes stop_codon:yes gene_type:complete
MYKIYLEKLFPKIIFILGNNAVESIGVKSNYFREDLDVCQFIIRIKTNKELFNHGK